MRIAFESEAEDVRAGRGRRGARAARDRLRPRAGGPARRAARATSRATRRSTCPSTCGWRRAPFRHAVLEQLRAGAARADRHLRRARRARRQPQGRPRRRHGVRAQPGPDRRALPPRAARARARLGQLRAAGPERKRRAARRSKGASCLGLFDRDRLDDHRAAGWPEFGSAWMPPIFVDDVHALGDLAQQRVVGRQRAAPSPVTTKNCEPDVPGGLVPRLGHRDDALRVLEVARRRLLDRVAGAAVAVAGRVAALDHEVRDDPVEGQAVEELLVGQVLERAAGDRGAAWRPA